MPSPPPSQGQALGMLVGGIVVEHEVEIEFRRGMAVDGSQEAQELLMAAALHALPDHRPGGDIKGGEQRGRAMALIIMGHGAGAALLDRQPRLGAVERLDLALLVGVEHHRLVRRAQVEADDILDPCSGQGQAFSTNRLSFDSLKPRTRCGLSPCAFQIRRTLVWLRPTVWAIVRVLHWVAAGGFSCRVLSTTCAITSGANGGLRPGRLASRLSPAIPCAT